MIIIIINNRFITLSKPQNAVYEYSFINHHDQRVFWNCFFFTAVTVPGFEGTCLYTTYLLLYSYLVPVVVLVRRCFWWYVVPPAGTYYCTQVPGTSTCFTLVYFSAIIFSRWCRTSTYQYLVCYCCYAGMCTPWFKKYNND